MFNDVCIYNLIVIIIVIKGHNNDTNRGRFLENWSIEIALKYKWLQNINDHMMVIIALFWGDRSLHLYRLLWD